LDGNGYYYVGTDGNPVEYKITEGKSYLWGLIKTSPKIKITGGKPSEDLQTWVDNINSSKSPTAIEMFDRGGQNPTKIHYVIEKKFVDNDLFGLHVPYDSEGKVLGWSKKTMKFSGQPAYNPNGEYSEVKITLFLGNIEKAYSTPLDVLRESVSISGHELDHNTNQEVIDKIRNGTAKSIHEIENPAEKVEEKIRK
jgi:hypothetical protein